MYMYVCIHIHNEQHYTTFVMSIVMSSSFHSQVVSDPVGYGFVIRGSRPVYVHAVDPNGPAQAVGLKVRVLQIRSLSLIQLSCLGGSVDKSVRNFKLQCNVMFRGWFGLCNSSST